MPSASLSSPLGSCLALSILLLPGASRLVADEGMWMPSQIPDLATALRDRGFEGDPAAFADLTGHPMGAIVWLGGCTASFVSPEGLVATNHHCATGALQYNSTPERNRLEDGFLARTREGELWNGPGSRLWVTIAFEEVTEAITGGIDARLDGRARHDVIERRTKERTASCEEEGLRCRVLPFFEGLRYYELAQREIRDVRLVYAPADGIGNFGGETDNWRWPRHTGDWAFFRAYVGRDGRAADHSPDNVPYRPRHWLKIQPAGVGEGDLVFVVGYPGTTRRHATFEEVKEITEGTFPQAIRAYEEQIAILEDLGRADEGLRIKAATRLQGLQNALTNRRGMLEGLVDGGILAAKEAAQEELAGWIAASPERRSKWGHALPGLTALLTGAAPTRERDFVLEQLLPSLESRLRLGRASLASAAHTALLLSRERPKADVDRERGLQERDRVPLREIQERLQRTLDVRLDRALLRWALRRAAALPPDQRIGNLDKLIGLTPGMAAADSGPAIETYLERLYAGTKMADLGFRLSLLDSDLAGIRAASDPFLDLAAALDPLFWTELEAEKERHGTKSRLRPLYMQALLEKAGGRLAPDANRTLRVTFGQVRGVDAKDQDGIWWKPFTTLAGIEQKHTGEGDFDAPRRQLEAIRALREGRSTPYVSEALGDVPVDFLSTLDITGGNSGSPTLDGRGELVGLVFDGTYDTIASDFVFDDVRTRAIHVDVRYILWTLAEVEGANHLLEEMGAQ